MHFTSRKQISKRKKLKLLGSTHRSGKRLRFLVLEKQMYRQLGFTLRSGKRLRISRIMREREREIFACNDEVIAGAFDGLELSQEIGHGRSAKIIDVRGTAEIEKRRFWCSPCSGSFFAAVWEQRTAAKSPRNGLQCGRINLSPAAPPSLSTVWRRWQRVCLIADPT